VSRSRARGSAPRAIAVCAAAVYALPLVAALAIAMVEGGRVDAWRRLTADPQVPPALLLSVGTALASTLLALLLALVLATHLHGSRAWRLFGRTLGPMLAVPHAAFAIGFALLVMPAGLIARLIAPIVGWDAPPHWPTVHDPWGIGLVTVLVLKETPFLLWSLTALLARPDVDAAVHRQLAIGRTLGYSAEQVWWRVVWPQWLPRLAWPLAAVLAYGLTVVDLALIIGPTSPPTLAVLAWQALLDASATRNAEGAAAAVALVLALLALVALGAWLMRGWTCGHAAASVPCSGRSPLASFAAVRSRCPPSTSSLSVSSRRCRGSASGGFRRCCRSCGPGTRGSRCWRRRVRCWTRRCSRWPRLLRRWCSRWPGSRVRPGPGRCVACRW
jgi:putative thiamine transport system permease protein